MDHTTRRTFLQLPAAAAGAGLIPAGAATEPTATDIWFEGPATRWEEALAIGNGRLGAMTFGGLTFRKGARESKRIQPHSAASKGRPWEISTM